MKRGKKTETTYRYFLISYYVCDKSGFRFCDIAFPYKGFPGRSFINKRISKTQPKTTTNIINSIYEFKNKVDYKSFRDGGE